MGLKKSSSRGMFVHSCYLHTHFPFYSETWESITLANKTIEQSIADWYFDRSSFQEIDTKNNEFPRNCAYTYCPAKPLESVPLSSSCVNNLKNCNSTEIGIMRDSRRIFIETLLGLKKNRSRGMFVHSCYLHMHFASSNSETWMSITLANKTIEQAVSDWYFDRGSFREIDFKHVLPLNCTDSFQGKKSLTPRNGLMSFIFSSFSFN